MGSIIKEAEMLESMTKKAVSSKVFIDKQTFESVKDKISLSSEVNNSEIFYRELSL